MCNCVCGDAKVGRSREASFHQSRLFSVNRTRLVLSHQLQYTLDLSQKPKARFHPSLEKIVNKTSEL